jgi:hypothetical protein
MDNLRILLAMELLAKTLNYSNTYKQELLDTIQQMIRDQKES